MGDDRGTSHATNGAEMGRGLRGGQIGTKVELRAEEDKREEQCQDAQTTRVLVHGVNKMELRQERLRGQVLRLGLAP
jgi:hypothetical protein